jgi:beta-glucosidase/6-phospho-beta-glucosidase/beta-galactosidase
MHYGWPEDLDIFSSAFPGRFARYAKAFLRTFVDEGLAEPAMVLSLVNEISFFAWAGGDVAMLNPFRREQSGPLKFQLVRAVIEGAHAVREVLPSVRLLHVDPLMHVAPRTSRRKEGETARDLHVYQYQAIDMVTGRTWQTQLGGSPDLIDVIGVNYYRNNQRFLDGEFIEGHDARYRPLSELLLEVHRRYGKPMLVAETGAEDDDRVPWMRYASFEVARAMRAGCPLHGLTWYPIVNHPGWADDRHIHNGLWDYADDAGARARYEPLAEEIVRSTSTLGELSERYVLGRADGAAP